MAGSFDYLFVGGIAVLVVAFTSFLNAFSSSRQPRFAILLTIVGAGMIGYPMIEKPKDYQPEAVPEIIIRVIADIVR